jgi:hypothetical protein
MDSSSLIFIAAFFFLTGAVVIIIIWALVSFVRKGSRKRTSSSASASDHEEIARLMRDRQTQDLVVQMDGKSFKDVQELSTTQQHRLSFTSNVLVNWLGQGGEAGPAGQEGKAEPGEQAVAPAAPEEALEQPTPPEPADKLEVPFTQDIPSFSEWIPAETLPVDQATSHVPPFDDERVPELKPVSTHLPDMVGGILNPKPKPAPVYKSIAMQINDILQERMAGTPFETRGITVSDAPDHGVSVSLDGEKYAGVKEIPDESVRNLIRSAVQEWEKQGKENST